MQNYKVEVQNHSEEIYKLIDILCLNVVAVEVEKTTNGSTYIYLSRNSTHNGLDSKEITLQELRAMVSANKYEELAKKYDGVKLSKLANGFAFNGNYVSVVVYPDYSKIVCEKTEITQVFDDSLFEELECKLDQHFPIVKPKQKEEVKMKEYLVKNAETGDYFLTRNHSNFVGAIEIPEGAEKLIYSKENNNNYHFVNAKNELWCVTTNDTKWYECGITYSGYFNGFGCVVVWQRESLNDQVASAEQARQEQTQTREISECDLIDSGKLIIGGFGESFPVGLEHHKFIQPEGFSEGGFIPNQKKDESKLFDTGKFIIEYFTQPEELPFVDDEPKLRNIKIRVNGDFDKALEAIQNMGYWNCQFNRIPRNCYWLVGNADATVDYGSEQHMYIDHHVEYFVDGAIDKTQETLNERKSTYGDFKDVAGMTQELLAVMEQYGYSDMPKPHKEALHMICSKMARIVNGDHNHLDSWHDIGGYAKLIENNIK